MPFAVNVMLDLSIIYANFILQQCCKTSCTFFLAPTYYCTLILISLWTLIILFCYTAVLSVVTQLPSPGGYTSFQWRHSKRLCSRLQSYKNLLKENWANVGSSMWVSLTVHVSISTKATHFWLQSVRPTADFPRVCLVNDAPGGW